jgi:hypothetical protein
MNKKLLLILLLLVSFCWGHTALAGFGISPPYVRNDYLIPGSSYEQKINLLRSSAEDDLQASIEVDAPEIASWLTIDKGMSFTLPKGELRVPMTVRVNVPKNAEIATYQGHINVKVASAESTGPGVAVALGARIDIDLRLTRETRPDFLVRQVVIHDFEELDWPWNKWPLKYFFFRVKSTLKIENTGNVKVAPTKILLDVYDSYRKNLLESSFDKSLKKIPPYSTMDITASFPTNLTPAQYWGKIKIYKDDQVLEAYDLTFRVYPKGGLGNNGLGIWPKILVGSIIAISLLILFILFKLRKPIWIILVIIFYLIWNIVKKIFSPIVRLLVIIYDAVKKRLFRWILKKAKEHEEKDKR